MDVPFMVENTPLSHATTLLPAFMPIPGLGSLAVNAFLIEATQPLLVDTGLAVLADDFMGQLRSLIDPANLRWIWITHADADHVGNLAKLLRVAPDARIVTTFLGMGKMQMQGIPMDRVHLLNPGQVLNIGDRELRALVPPLYDAPETTALFDTRSRYLFSSDCFGALLPEPAASAAEVDQEALRKGLLAWAGIDAPWVRQLERGQLQRMLEQVKTLDPELLLSSHLPPARGMTEQLCEWLGQVGESEALSAPDQAAFEAMLQLNAA